MSLITVSDLVLLRKRGIYQGFGNIVFDLRTAAGGMWGAFFQKYAG
jgi:hypothetical protein